MNIINYFDLLSYFPQWIIKNFINIYQKISKSERILLVGLYGLLLLNCDLLPSLIRDYKYSEKEPNFKLSINVVARSKQIMMDI